MSFDPQTACEVSWVGLLAHLTEEEAGALTSVVAGSPKLHRTTSI